MSKLSTRPPLRKVPLAFIVPSTPTPRVPPVFVGKVSPMVRSTPGADYSQPSPFAQKVARQAETRSE